MSLTCELLEKYFKIFNYNDEIELKIIDIQPDAFKNCRNRKIRSLQIQYAHYSSTYSNLELNRNHLSLFEPLREHLEELTLNCNFLCEFNFLEHLNKLKKLNLLGSFFSNGKPVFNGANNQLTHLDLSKCKLKISDKTMFNDLKHLTHLNLSKVALDDNVLPDLFSELKQLDTLKMNGTQFKPAEDAFIYLTNLRELHFYGIEIPDEYSNIFAPLKSLQKLEMGETNTFNNEAFRQVNNLRQLKLYSISTIKIDENFFDQHPNLESLGLLYLNSGSNDKYCIDMKALANLKALKSLNLSNNNLNVGQDCETIFSLENLESLDLSHFKRSANSELKFDETTFERMSNLKKLNLSGDRIKLEGNCFKHLPQLRELDLSNTILYSDNNDYDIFSSLKQLETIWLEQCEPCESFKLYRLSELVNLRKLQLRLTEHDLEQFREMLRRKRRRGEEVELPDPTYDDLCYFILGDLTKLTTLRLSFCNLTHINNRVLSQMKDLSSIDLQVNNIQHIPDDTFDCLSSLEEVYLSGNPIQQIKLNRLFLKCDKLKRVSLGGERVVDLMEEQFNFRSIVQIDCMSFYDLKKFYDLRRAFLRQNQIKSQVSSDSEMKNVELMFQSIDNKLNQIKNEKEKSFEQLKPFVVDQIINVDPIEDKLNQVRQEMIDKLKEIHDTSINEMNALIKKYKQPNHWSTKSMREESLKQAIQSAEKILKSQLKLPTTHFSLNLFRLSIFFQITLSNAFKGMKLVKYVSLMPGLVRPAYKMHNEQSSTLLIPINKNKILSLSAPFNSFDMCDYQKCSDKYAFAILNLKAGSFNINLFYDNPRDIPSENSLINTFSLVNDHLVTVRKYSYYDATIDFKEFAGKFHADRLEKNHSIECHNSKRHFNHILLIDVYDVYMNKRSQATIKYCYPDQSTFVHTCGNGILIQTRQKTVENDSHSFALYSLGMKLKRKRIRVDTAEIEFKPIKFDDEKCYIYQNNELECSTSIVIYSFTDSSLLQEINISVPPQKRLYRTMAIDSDHNLYFTCDTSRTINCFNLKTKEQVIGLLPEIIFNKLTLDKDEQISLSYWNASENLHFHLNDILHCLFFRINK